MDGGRAVTIVGAGPAGLAAAIHLNRAGLAPLLLERNVPGGLLRYSDRIENYPGFPTGISGERLSALMLDHLVSLGGTVTIASVDHVDRSADGTYIVMTSLGPITSISVILATGTRPRTIEIPGLKELEGRFAFYDLFELMICSGKGDRVLVYGGGDSAFDQALRLSGRGYELSIQCRSDSCCLPLLRERAERRGIGLREGRPIVSLRKCKEGVNVTEEGGTNVIVDRLLIACGREPRLDVLSPSLQAAYISTGSGERGLYLAGDVVAGIERQAGIAVGSGMSAAMRAERYIERVRSDVGP